MAYAQHSGRQKGITLIELMVASIMSIMIVSSVLSIYVNSQHSSRTQSLTRQIQENGRYAIQILGEDIRMAKYYGINVMPSTIDTSTTDALTGVGYGCGGTTWAANVTQPIFASNNSNPYSASCIAASSYIANTDVLVVRHTESEPIVASEIIENHLYLYTSLTDGEVFRASEDGAINTQTLLNVTEFPAETYKFSTNVFYVRPCSIMNGSDCSDDGIPTLVRQSLSADGTTTEPLIEYIEDMQVVFGLDLSSPEDFTVDRYVSPADVSDWSRVISARIDLLVRSPNTVTGYTNPHTYTIGDKSVTQADGYHRKVFSGTIFLRNPSLDNGTI